MTGLFDPLALRGITLSNRIGVSPMCQYSALEGCATDWHLVHLGGLAQGGAGLVFTEATAVSLEGRISPQDLGIWEDRHIEPLARVTRFIRSQGAIPAIQLAHAGRKACTKAPWLGSSPMISVSEGGWIPVAPSALAFDENGTPPLALDEAGISGITLAFTEAAKRSLEAGFQAVELHAAHGYLLHQFLSPLANRRTDRYGGSFENRTRLLLEITASVRAVWPERLPLFVRLSATDWSEGGWNAVESVELCVQLRELGVDLVDVSSGGLVPHAQIPLGPGYQVPFARQIRVRAALPTAAVGLITAPEQAQEIIAGGQADLVLLGRELLRNPRWPLHAARELGVEIPWPAQYARGAQGKVPVK